MRLYLGLVHYPVYDKRGRRVAAALTTLDIHDLARVARTYDVRALYVIQPLEEQRALAERIKTHWTEGYGAEYNRYRGEAMARVRVTASVEQAVEEIRGAEGEPPRVIATAAKPRTSSLLSHRAARKLLEAGHGVLLLFGTAWGLEESVLKTADFVLAPVMGRCGYNHLSVRSASAIIVDRLVGDPLPAA